MAFPAGRRRGMPRRGWHNGGASDWSSGRLCLLHSAVDDLDWIEERHCRTEVRTDLLDRVLRLFLADAGELVTPSLVLFDELLGEGAVLDFFEQLLHGLLGFGGDDAGA